MMLKKMNRQDQLQRRGVNIYTLISCYFLETRLNQGIHQAVSNRIPRSSTKAIVKILKQSLRLPTAPIDLVPSHLVEKILQAKATKRLCYKFSKRICSKTKKLTKINIFCCHCFQHLKNLMMIKNFMHGQKL